MRSQVLMAGLCGVVVLGACAASGFVDPLAGRRMTPPPIDYGSLLTHPDRPGEDYADDAYRLPDDVLEFAGVQHGMTVLELEAGSGYYTELLSYAVGADGRVLMHNPEEFDVFIKEDVERRLADRLANVQRLQSPFDALALGDGEVDMVTWILGPHDIWASLDGIEDGALGDPDGVFAEIARVLKPGGVFIVLDHAAPDGTPVSSTTDLHRVDPGIVDAHAGRAGFDLVETSSLLANPADDFAAHVFAPEVRRKTDRFLFKFIHQPAR